MKKLGLILVVVGALALPSSSQASGICGQWVLHQGQSVRFNATYDLNDVSFTAGAHRKQLHRRFYAFGTTSWQAAYGHPGTRWDAEASSGTNSLGPWFKAQDNGAAPLIVNYPCS